ncbi:hypothetical protein F2P45_13035 [Massilia sp. CCM 8733]|uniref:Tetratricopeptide repeat protein n=1 Tax=Massilia mucilaginosa TaxID=2609282 RepID=A0ABX0NT31_9BURK|nr:hypothetical protein [Massilia mucilaginosa]NHZ89929.1 hypothetical protein [Massilia mucilaginosa]
MASKFSTLNEAELLQLAINASASGNDGAAIVYFKEAASRPDASGTTHFLLGAHYAQIQMYDRAVGEMESALALEPGLSIARFQLGLLWLTNGDAERAVTVLSPLQELPDSDPLRVFGHGLILLAQNQLPEASAALAKGIELNNTNLALNKDMQMFIDDIAKAIADSPAPPVVPAFAAAADEPVEDNPYHRHLLMSAYGGTLPK